MPLNPAKLQNLIIRHLNPIISPAPLFYSDYSAEVCITNI
ncbi:hypothetical protein MuYL_1599 [Mucilaginibacter xinganensis]|uniref:Uncharacterized protein n=1 Tax=Mucilaginibacter xinganensis TaxID=1234841 RepID=A0A223NUF6_9SPHI|nr:hypothetical protein MuYL_1599 [Mucilaginibacter xinganensis]